MGEGAVEPVIWVRRHGDEYHTAAHRLGDLTGVHSESRSRGVGGSAPRPLLHGYVYCDRAIEGGVPHSCQHSPPPHRIKVCVVKQDNDPADIAALLGMIDATAEARRQLGARYGRQAESLLRTLAGFQRLGIREDPELAEIRAAGVDIARRIAP